MDKYKIDGVEIYQPDRDLSYNFETTYTSDSTRTINGRGHFAPMFTVEQCGYSATNIPADEASKILKLVVGRKFMLHYFSVYRGEWTDREFHVGKGELSIGTLNPEKNTISKLSFNMTGVDKLK